jgi:hypothetical protein
MPLRQQNKDYLDFNGQKFWNKKQVISPLNNKIARMNFSWATEN